MKARAEVTNHVVREISSLRAHRSHCGTVLEIPTRADEVTGSPVLTIALEKLHAEYREGELAYWAGEINGTKFTIFND